MLWGSGIIGVVGSNAAGATSEVGTGEGRGSGSAAAFGDDRLRCDAANNEGRVNERLLREGLLGVAVFILIGDWAVL